MEFMKLNLVHLRFNNRQKLYLSWENKTYNQVTIYKVCVKESLWCGYYVDVTKGRVIKNNSQKILDSRFNKSYEYRKLDNVNRWVEVKLSY